MSQWKWRLVTLTMFSSFRSFIVIRTAIRAMEGPNVITPRHRCLDIWQLKYPYYFDRRSNWLRFLRRTLSLKATTEFEKLDPSISLPTYDFYEFTENGSLAVAPAVRARVTR